MVTRFLSLYQIIGILILIEIISIWSSKEEGMAIFLVLFAGILFLPFFIVATFSLLDITKYKKVIQVGVWIGVILLIIPSYSLPIFYGFGGIVIAVICTGIGVYIWIERRQVKKQILIFNILGSIILTVLSISFIIIEVV